VSRYHQTPATWGATGLKLRDATLDLYGTTCALCGLPGADSSDHVTPLSLGGHPTDLANRQPAHQSCNRQRGALTMAEWFAKHPLPTRPQLDPSREW
jgi:5-methylcytosine-specific restriction endonuclease McrA